MAISITSTPGRAGPGSAIFVTWTSGAPADDQICVTDSGNLVTGCRLTHGANSGFVFLGYIEPPPSYIAAGDPAADGTSMTLTASRFHTPPGLAVESSSASTGWTFDSTSGLPNLLNFIYQRMVDPSAELDAILAAVQKTFPATS